MNSSGFGLLCIMIGPTAAWGKLRSNALRKHRMRAAQVPKDMEDHFRKEAKRTDARDRDLLP